MTQGNGYISIGDADTMRDINAAIDKVRHVREDLLEPVAREVLPKLGDQLAADIRASGPRSARKRLPGKRDKWRDPSLHAVDTIRRGAVQRDKDSGDLYVMVGPKRGDNSPSFYLKFLEYGTIYIQAAPFIRPARRVLMQTRAAPAVLAALNKRIGSGG